MIDDYGEIKNKERGKLLYVPTRERVWWRVVKSGDGSGVAEVGMGIWRYLRYLLRWSCEMEWNGMERTRMR